MNKNNNLKHTYLGFHVDPFLTIKNSSKWDFGVFEDSFSL